MSATVAQNDGGAGVIPGAAGTGATTGTHRGFGDPQPEPSGDD